ncbi:E3 ubiquitin-protein ligase TRIM63-like [Glandiceps talaboti]
MAMSQRSEIMNGLEYELTCPICMEIFQQPLKLPCEHDLCQRCADNLLKSQPDREGRRPRRFRCPECREKIRVDERGVHGLRRNVRLQNIIDRFVASSKAALDERLKTSIELNVSNYKALPNTYCHDEKRKALEDMKEMLSSEIDKLSTANTRVENMLAEMNNMKCFIRDDSLKCKKTLDCEIESLLDLIQKRKADLIEKINRKHLEKVQFIDDRIQKCHKVLDDGQHAITHVEDVLQNIDNESIAKDFQTLRQSIIEMKTSVDACLREPMMKPKLGFEMDFKLQKDVLQMLDLISNEPTMKLKAEIASPIPTQVDKFTIPTQRVADTELTLTVPRQHVQVVEFTTPAQHVAQFTSPAQHVTQFTSPAQHVAQFTSPAQHVTQCTTPAQHVTQYTTPAHIQVPKIPRIPLVATRCESLQRSTTPSSAELQHIYLMPDCRSPCLPINDVSSYTTTDSTHTTYPETPSIIPAFNNYHMKRSDKWQHKYSTLCFKNNAVSAPSSTGTSVSNKRTGDTTNNL